MLLKRAKRLLTSAFPDTGKALFPNTQQNQNNNHGQKMETSQSSHSGQSVCCYHSVSVTTNISNRTLPNIRATTDELNKPIITTEAKCFEINENSGSVTLT